MNVFSVFRSYIKMCGGKRAFEGLLNIEELFENNFFWYTKAPEGLIDIEKVFWQQQRFIRSCKYLRAFEGLPSKGEL